MKNIWQTQTNIDWSSFWAFKLQFDKRSFSRQGKCSERLLSHIISVWNCNFSVSCHWIIRSPHRPAEAFKSAWWCEQKLEKKTEWILVRPQIYTKTKLRQTEINWGQNENVLVLIYQSHRQMDQSDVHKQQQATVSLITTQSLLPYQTQRQPDLHTTHTHTQRRWWVYTQVGPAPALQVHILFTGHSREQRPSTHTHTHTHTHYQTHTHSHTEWGNTHTHTSCVAAAQFSVNLLHTSLPVRAEGQWAA